MGDFYRTGSVTLGFCPTQHPSPAPEFLQIHGWMLDMDADRILYLSLLPAFSYAIMFLTKGRRLEKLGLSISACSLLILRSRDQRNNWICSKSKKLELLSFLLH